MIAREEDNVKVVVQATRRKKQEKNKNKIKNSMDEDGNQSQSWQKYAFLAWYLYCLSLLSPLNLLNLNDSHDLRWCTQEFPHLSETFTILAYLWSLEQI